MLEPVPCKPPFDDGTAFYCKNCDTYTSDFAPSLIRRQYRICKSCYNAHRSRQQYIRQDPLTRLRLLLYKALYARRQQGLAKALTNETMQTILHFHGVSFEEIERILPPKDPNEMKDLTKYAVVKHYK